MDNVAVIVQARMGSARLPGKAMMSLAGRPLLVHVLTRAQASGLPVTLATSDLERDAPLVEIATRLGVSTWTGSEWDVLDRFTGAALASGAQTIVRITGDCPFLDPSLIGLTIETHIGDGVDYTSNDTSRSGYPDGLDVEVFTLDALVAASKKANSRTDREHVTPWIKWNLRSSTLMCKDGDYSSRKLSVDRPDDYQFALAVYRHLAPGAYSMWSTLAACRKVEEEMSR